MEFVVVLPAAQSATRDSDFLTSELDVDIPSAELEDRLEGGPTSSMEGKRSRMPSGFMLRSN